MADPPAWMQIATAVGSIASPLVAYVVADRTSRTTLRVASRQITSAQELARKQVQASVVSANRQKWVDSVRDDISTFLSELDVVRASLAHHALTPSERAIAVRPLVLVYARVRLRLNPAKPKHVEIIQLMQDMLENVAAGDMRDKSDRLVELGQGLFRQVGLQIKAGD